MLFLAFFYSFISSILRLFPRSDLQYSCIISKSLFTVLGLCLSRYSPHGPKFLPRTAASMILCFATSGPLVRSLMMRSRYSYRVRLPCLRLWKLHDVTSSGLTARKLAFSSDRSWLQDRMVPKRMFVYHRWDMTRNARKSAFALHVEPPPAASIVASY